MKLAVMQPYFFPYIGYFQLLNSTDKFILLDTVQFIRHGWIERNRVRKQDDDWMYIKVPLVKGDGRATKIQNAMINHSVMWQQTIVDQLQFYRKKAPYYRQTMDVVRTALSNDCASITKLDQVCLQTVCSYLGIDVDIKVFSEMDLAIDIPAAPDEWALNICKSIGGVAEYWNPSGGMKFFDNSKYLQNGISLKFLAPKSILYTQGSERFIDSLSIIDIMMYNSVSDVIWMLNQYTIADSPEACSG